MAGGDRDAPWFAVAAFTERRVLVEGWSYDYADLLSSAEDAALNRLGANFA